MCLSNVSTSHCCSFAGKQIAVREAMDNGNMTVILFGAFDRHNFGDLLFPHVVSALLAPEQAPVWFAGLAARDLRPFGGHQTIALNNLHALLGERPVTLIHAGGELLTCSAWEAAVMLSPMEAAVDIMRRFDGRSDEAQQWASRYLGVEELAPYAVHRSSLPAGSRIFYNAVGGVDLDQRAPALRAEVLAKLRDADGVTVRDRVTQRLLQGEGIDAALMPDPAALVAELFGDRIAAYSTVNEVLQIRNAFPSGYIAVQCSSEFDDDATLYRIADELDRHAISSGHGIAFFRAGAAPWHDDLQIYCRIAERMHAPSRVLESLDIWEICALIARSEAYVGSSLHGRIVAMACSVPRVGLVSTANACRIGKQQAYVDTWEISGMPGAVDVHEISTALSKATGIDRHALARHAKEIAAKACPA
jgi:hypothetical protein